MECGFSVDWGRGAWFDALPGSHACADGASFTCVAWFLAGSKGCWSLAWGLGTPAIMNLSIKSVCAFNYVIPNAFLNKTDMYF